MIKVTGAVKAVICKCLDLEIVFGVHVYIMIKVKFDYRCHKIRNTGNVCKYSRMKCLRLKGSIVFWN